MKVFFAIPMYRGRAHAECVRSLEGTLRLFESRGHEAVVATCARCCYVQFARNRLVWDFLKTDCDKLFFIDDDISWSAEDALRLALADDDVVSGVYRKKEDQETYPVVIFTNGQDRPQVRSDGAIAAWGVPAGMLAIRRNVIESLIAAHPEKRYFDFVDGVREEGFYDLFPQGVYGDRWVGEDFAFCEMWRALSGQIWVLPDMTMSHHEGDKAWTGNYHEFLLKQPGGSLDPARNSQ